MKGAGRRVPPRAFAFLLGLYPRAFRARFGEAMSETFAEELAAARHRGRFVVASLWARAAFRTPLLALEEHMRIGRRSRRLAGRSIRGAGAAILDAWAQDVRFAVRSLGRAPGFIAVTVLTIGLGAGATTTLFSLTNALLFRPLPVAAPDRLVRVQEERSGRVSTGMEGTRLPYARYQAYEESTRDVFSGLAAQNLRYFSMRADGPAFPVAAVMASGNFFDVLGVHPAAGRFFAADHEPVVVLAYRLWQHQFGGSPDVVGRTIYLNGHVMTVAGVAARDFGGTVGFMSVDVWVPYGAHGAAAWPDAWVNLFGRLRPGVELAQAAAVVNAVALRIPPDEPNTEVKGALLEGMTGMPTMILGMVGGFLRLLVVTAVLVLLIGSANIAGMLIARAATRRRDVAVRLALGAGRARLVRQLLAEASVLFLIGGAAGVVVAIWTTRLLSNLPLPIQEPLLIDATPDVRVLAFSLGTVLMTGMLFALLPALQASRPALAPTLRDGGRTETTRGARTRGVFVAAQIAMSVVLLVGAGLFVRTLQRALSADPGFTPDSIVIATVNLAPHGYDPERGRAFYAQLTERVRALPGVDAAALAQLAMLTGESEGHGNWRARPDEPSIHASLNTVDAAYFDALRVPLAAGRGIDETDVAGAPAAIVINQTLARQLWPDEHPIGRFVLWGDDPYEVVGVARDGKYASFGEPLRAFVFLSAAQRYMSKQVLHVRTRPGANAAAVITAIRNEVAALDADVAVERAMPLPTAVDFMLFPQRFAAWLIGVFGALGLALAGIGVYGVLAHNVAQRSRELGIRVALGADARSLLRIVMARGAVLGAAGGAIGLAGAAILTRFLGGLLHGVSPLDPITFMGVPLVLAAVALVASYVPARRVLRVDPMSALRQE